MFIQLTRQRNCSYKFLFLVLGICLLTVATASQWAVARVGRLGKNEHRVRDTERMRNKQWAEAKSKKSVSWTRGRKQGKAEQNAVSAFSAR